MLHRPDNPSKFEGVTEVETPSIMLAAAESFEDFVTDKTTHKLLATSEFDWEEERVGASFPPIDLGDGQWLVSYHGKQLPDFGYTGYLSGSYVRDKDAVDGAFLICEMFAYYKTRGISLLDKLEELYQRFGYCLNALHSYEFEGSAGLEKMNNIMASMRDDMSEIGGLKIEKLNDYLQGIDGLPKSDVIKFYLEGNSSVVVRPSGTEPKMKVYVSVSADSRNEAEKVENSIVSFMEQRLK